MSNVAEGRTSGARIRTVDHQDAFSGFGQSPGYGTAHNASANDGEIRRGRKAVSTVSGDDHLRLCSQRAAAASNIVCDRKAVLAVAYDGEFVLAHLRLAHRGS
jgi:hypothetical protein